MGRAHPIAEVVIKTAGENGGTPFQPEVPGNDVGGEFFLHGLEQVAGEDRLMLAAIHLTPVIDLADVEPVLEEMSERSHAEADPAALLAITVAIDLGPDAPPIERHEQSPHGAQLQ